MSENNIDVNVNFHLDDINNLFEKIIQGAVDVDIFNELDKLDPVKGSLLSDITGQEDKLKFIEALNKLNVEAPMMQELVKMMTELQSSDEEGNEMLIQTQSSLITMLSISRLMLKMIEEKFPITEEVQQGIDDMNKVLSDQEMILDDKIEMITRTLNSILASSTSQNPAFRVITPTVSLANVMSPSQRKNMQDEFEVNARIITDLINMIEGAEGGRIRTPQLEVEFVQDALNRIQELFSQTQTTIDEGLQDLSQRNRTIQPAEPTEGQEVQRRISRDIEQEMRTILHIGEMIQMLKTSLDEYIVEMKGKMDDAMTNMDVATEAIIKTAQDLDPNKIGITKDQMREMKNILKDGLDRISDRIGEMDQQLMNNMFDNAVERGLIAPPADVQKRRTLDFYIQLIESTFNRLITDASKMTPKTQEIMKEAGLGQLTPIPGILERAKKVRDRFHPEDVVFDVSAERNPMLDISMMEAMFEQIQDKEQQQTVFLGAIKDDMKDMLEVVKKTEQLSSETKGVADEMNKNFGRIRGAITSASDQILSTKKSLDATNKDVGKVIDKINEYFGGDEMQRSE